MKKVVLGTVLAVVSAAVISNYAAAQQAVNAGQQPGAITLPNDQLKDYHDAEAQTSPAAQGAAWDAFLTKYPDTPVKQYVLNAELQAWAPVDPAKALATGDKVLALDPTNLTALTMEVYLRKTQADQLSDAAQKQPLLDAATPYAQKALAAQKPKDMAQADFDALRAQTVPMFYDVIGSDAMGRKDYAGAIDTFQKELTTLPEAQTKTWGAPVIDTLQLAYAYNDSTPPDLIRCTFYASRFMAYADPQFKQQGQQLANYCYNKYHGNMTGYETVQAAAAANLAPPADLKITPAPKPPDIARQTVATTPDLSTLALSDREFILINGSEEDPASHVKDSDAMWNAMKGKKLALPGSLVIGATASTTGGIPTQLQLAVSDDAQVNKTADVTVNLTPLDAPAEPTSKAPAALAKYKREKQDYDKKVADINTAVAVGQKINFQATFDSFATTPNVMITMSGGEVLLPEAEKPKGPMRPTGARKPGAGRK